MGEGDGAAAVSATTRRQRWFELGKAAAHRAAGRDLGGYPCPLCLQVFPDEALIDGRLTDEHVPPAAIGGRRMVLTCADCNRAAGASIDAEAAKEVRLRDLLGGVSTREHKVQWQGLESRMRLTGDEVSIQVVPKANHPDKVAAAFAALDSQLSDGRTTGSMNITFRDAWQPQAVDLSYLRSGYPAAFACLGYRWAAHDALDPVRVQIANPADLTLPAVVVGDDGGVDPDRTLLNVKQPAWTRGIAVKIAPRVVYLPGPGDIQFFARFAAGRAELGDGDAHMEVDLWPWPTEATYRLDK